MDRRIDPTRVVDIREFAARMAYRLEIPTKEIMREISGMVEDLKSDPNTENRLQELTSDGANPSGLDAIANPAWREWLREMSLWKLVEMDLSRLHHATPDDPTASRVITEYEENQRVRELRDM